MSVATRRLARLARTGSPAAVVRAARREVGLRRAESALEAGLAASGPVAVGPFVGEVGYELLYWRPFVLRLLRSRNVEPERVTVVGRGGSATWYGEYAENTVDVFDLVAPERVRDAAARRPYGSPKQLVIEPFDRELLVACGLDGATLVHPRFMYWRSRYVWEGVQDVVDARRLGDFDPLPRTELPAELSARLPGRFIAVKAYFNDGLPDTPSSRSALAASVEAISLVAPVVLLTTPVAADDHGNWRASGDVVEIDDLLEPVRNLAQQVEVVARAQALVATYGGFSYAGPFLDVPTVAVSSEPEDNPHHEHVLRAALPGAAYVRTSLDPKAVTAALAP